jgi:hypothetical protein
MPIINSPIVGMRFYPPAQVLLEVIPAGTQIQLILEPTNPYDDKAVQVWVPVTSTVEPDDALVEQCFSQGYDLIAGRERGELVLVGMLVNSDGGIAKKLACQGNREVREVLLRTDLWRAELWFNPEGQPWARVIPGDEVTCPVCGLKMASLPEDCRDPQCPEDALVDRLGEL